MKNRSTEIKLLIIILLAIFISLSINVCHYNENSKLMDFLISKSTLLNLKDSKHIIKILKVMPIYALFIGLILGFILLFYYFIHIAKENKETYINIPYINNMAKKQEQIAKKANLQKDEIETLYEKTNAINTEFTDSAKALNNAQEQLRIQNERIFAMHSIAKNINSSLNIDILFEKICNLLRNILDYDSLGILLLDDDGKFLQLKHYDGPYVEGLLDMKFDVQGEGVCAYSFREKESVLLEDINEFENFIIVCKDVKQSMVSPLIYNNEAIGVFLVNSFKMNNLNEEKMETLDSFANLASTALYNAKIYSNLKNNYFSTAKALAKAIEAKDAYTKGHCDRVTELSVKTAKYMGFNDEQENVIKIAAILHDIGKIGVPEKILNKPGTLTSKEYDIVKRHSSIGYEILSDIRHLQHEREILYQHHERIDGKGYPLGLFGENILIEAKILSLADAFDAMTSYRPYRQVMTLFEALDEINNNLGTQFDPYVGKLFMDMIKKEYIKTGS